MTPQQLLGTAVRLFAIWLGITSLSYFSTIPTAIANAPVGGGTASTVAYALGSGYLLGALLLWFFPMLVSHKLLPRTQHTNALTFQAHELARVGCSLLGLWLFAKELPTLVWFLFRSFLITEATSSYSALAPEMKLEVAIALFECVFAAIVIIKSAAFARFVSKSSE